MIDDVTHPPFGPRSARRVALNLELAQLPPIRRRPRRHTPRIPWRGIAVFFLPYFVLAAILVGAILAAKGSE